MMVQARTSASSTSLRRQLLLWTGFALLLLSVGQGIGAGWSIWSLTRHGTEEQARLLAAKTGAELSSRFSARLDLVAAHARSWSTFPQLPHELADSTIRTMLETHPDLSSTYANWSDDASLELPFRESYYFRSGNGIERSEEATDASDTAEPWFHIPVREGRTAMLEPYSDEVDGHSILMTSVVAPILRGGNPLGLVGADIYLTDLQRMTDSIAPYGGEGQIILTSSDGLVLAWSGDSSAQGKDLDSIAPALGGIVHDSEDNHVGVLEAGFLTHSRHVPIPGGEAWHVIVRTPRSVLLAPFLKTLATGVPVAILLTLLALGAIWYLAGKIAAPLQSLSQAMQDIAQGDADLTRRVNASGSAEVGAAAESFNQFAETVRTLVDDARGQARQVEEESKRTRNRSESLEAAASAASSATLAATSATTRLSGTLEEVSRNARDSHADIDSMAAAIEEMSAAIDEIAAAGESTRRNATDAVNAAMAAATEVDTLAEASSEIGRVVDAISTISEQTKLLALNATIEAARAGEAGKGFAVVAGEVKELAKGTASALEDIRRRIEVMQGSSAATAARIHEARESIARLDAAVQSIASAVTEQSATTREIASSTARAAVSVDGIVRNIASAADESQTIAKDVAEAGDQSRRTDEIARDIMAGSTKLDEVAGTLDASLSRFRT